MKTTMKRIIALALVVVMMTGMAISTNAATGKENKVGALADRYTAGSGTFTMTDESRMFVVADTEPTGELLQTAQLIHRQFKADASFKGELNNMEFVWGKEESAKPGDVILKLDTASATGVDGYKLDVTETTAKVTAQDVDGLIYGANMLQKYFDANGGNQLAGFSAADAPDTKERTVMLDTGRKYYTVEWVCNFIKQMSWMGYNAIEIHFSEDGGYRADLWDPAFYKGTFQPENDFSWLCGSHVQSWVKDPYRNDPDANKYLTTEELVQICEVAKEYHIEVIPSFDSPAHMDYITWKFEQNYKSNPNYSFTHNGTTYKASSTKGCINYTGVTGSTSPTWPYYTTIDITEGTMAKAFVFELYEDMAEFFKEYAGSTKFNIGADEVNLSSEYAPKWNYSQFPGYVNELNRMLNSKGYVTRMFNDFIGSTTYNQVNAKAVYEFDKNIEIMYWNSDFNPTTGEFDEPIWHVKFFWENNTGSSDNWGDGGRIMYNCIQTDCYYVLRVAANASPVAKAYRNMDARNPENHNWTFYNSTEEGIYNTWYPADISEKGVVREYAAIIPDAQLGGAYFLIWNDYAALNTEAEVWNGVDDNTTNKGTKTYHYSLFDRMYSNIMKMWNSDINRTVPYNEFAAVRDSYGDFPGFTSCSTDANLAEAVAIEKAMVADHTELSETLKDRVSNTDEKYTAGSYAAYEAAYAAAVAVDGNVDSTAAEIAEAINNLNTAKANLVDLTTLKEATAAKVENDGIYTDETYAAYEATYETAMNVLANENASNEDVAAAVKALQEAKDALEKLPVQDETSDTIDVKLMARHFKAGKMVGLKITTAKDVSDAQLVIKGEGNVIVTPVVKVGKNQTLTSGDVKIWLVKFTAPEKGTYTYTVEVGEEKETFEFVAK